LVEGKNGGDVGRVLLQISAQNGWAIIFVQRRSRVGRAMVLPWAEGPVWMQKRTCGRTHDKSLLRSVSASWEALSSRARRRSRYYATDHSLQIKWRFDLVVLCQFSLPNVVGKRHCDYCQRKHFCSVIGDVGIWHSFRYLSFNSVSHSPPNPPNLTFTIKPLWRKVRRVITLQESIHSSHSPSQNRGGRPNSVPPTRRIL